MKFADLIPGLAEGASEALAKRQAQQNRLAEILFQEQAKQTFDPQAQAKRLALRTILGQPTPTPMGGYNPTERQAGLPQAVEQEAGQNRLRAFQRFGLLPKPPLNLEEIFAKSQAQAAGAAAGKGTAIDPEARRIAIQALAAKSQISTVFREAESQLPPPPVSGTAAVFGGLLQKGKASLGGNEQARAFKDTLRARLRNIARGLGERGVITDKDIEDFVKAMPDFQDSQTTRQGKFSNLMDTVDSLTNTFLQKKYGVGLSDVGSQSPPSREASTSPDSESAKARLRAKYGR